MPTEREARWSSPRAGSFAATWSGHGRRSEISQLAPGGMDRRGVERGARDSRQPDSVAPPVLDAESMSDHRLPLARLRRLADRHFLPGCDPAIPYPVRAVTRLSRARARSAKPSGSDRAAKPPAPRPRGHCARWRALRSNVASSEARLAGGGRRPGAATATQRGSNLMGKHGHRAAWTSPYHGKATVTSSSPGSTRLRATYSP